MENQNDVVMWKILETKKSAELFCEAFFTFKKYFAKPSRTYFQLKVLSCQDLANLVRRNYILLIKTSLYICGLSWLSIGLCWCILRVILLSRISFNYLFLKWQYSSIGPWIMTNFVKIGTKKSPQSGETDCSFDWLLILDTFAHQTSSWNLKL
jgi:hypothetical protein